jgi:hypothetical protein
LPRSAASIRGAPTPQVGSLPVSQVRRGHLSHPGSPARTARQERQPFTRARPWQEKPERLGQTQRFRLGAKPPAGTTQCRWGWKHPRSQYRERRSDACPRVVSIPPLARRYPATRPAAEARRRSSTVLNSNGDRLEIPTWMLSSEVGDARITEQACLSKHALQSLADLLAIRLPTEDNNHDARRRKGPPRGSRSDGAHSGSCISDSGSKKC